MVFTADSRWQTDLIYSKHDTRGFGVHYGMEETCSCSRGIPQREIQEQLSLRRIGGLCPYCVYWNDKSEGVCLNLPHVESVQKRVGASAAYKHFPDPYHSFLTNRWIICKSRACLFIVYSNLLHHTSADFISFSCSLADAFSCPVEKRTLNTNILMCFFVLHLSCIE